MRAGRLVRATVVGRGWAVAAVALRRRLEACPLAAPDCKSPRADGGRFALFMPAVCEGWFTGRLEFPKPAGARPLSVAFPCASQMRCHYPRAATQCCPSWRWTFAESWALPRAAGFGTARAAAATPPMCRRSRRPAVHRWRIVCRSIRRSRALIHRAIRRTVAGLFIPGVVRAGAFGVPVRWFIEPFAGRFAGLFTGVLPMRPEVRPLLLTVRTFDWDAPCAGAVRAITARF